MISALYREAEILERVDNNMTVSVTARIPPAFLGRLQGYPGVRVE
jgi:hypothetical protein